MDEPMVIALLGVGSVVRPYPFEGIKNSIRVQKGGYALEEKGIDVEALLKRYKPGSKVLFKGQEAMIKTLEIRDESGAPAVYIGIRVGDGNYSDDWTLYPQVEVERLGIRVLEGARLAQERTSEKNGRRSIDRYTRRLAYEIWKAKGSPSQSQNQKDSDWYVAERLIEDRSYFEQLNEDDLVRTLASRIWHAKYYPRSPQKQGIEQEKTDWYVAEHLARQILPKYKQLLGVYDAKRYSAWLSYALATLVQHEIGNELFIIQSAPILISDLKTAREYLERLGDENAGFLEKLGRYISQYNPLGGPKFYYTLDAVTPIAGEYTPAIEEQRTEREVPRELLADNTNLSEIFAVLRASRGEIANLLDELEDADDERARAIASELSEVAGGTLRFINQNAHEVRTRVRRYESFGLYHLSAGARLAGRREGGGLQDDEIAELTRIQHKFEALHRDKIGFVNSGTGLKAIPDETNDPFIFRELAGHAIHGYITARLDVPTYMITLDLLKSDVEDLTVAVSVFDEFLSKKTNSYRKTHLASEGGMLSVRLAVGLVQSSRKKQFKEEHREQIRQIRDGLDEFRGDIEALVKRIEGARLAADSYTKRIVKLKTNTAVLWADPKFIKFKNLLREYKDIPGIGILVRRLQSNPARRQPREPLAELYVADWIVKNIKGAELISVNLSVFGRESDALIWINGNPDLPDGLYWVEAKSMSEDTDRFGNNIESRIAQPFDSQVLAQVKKADQLRKKGIPVYHLVAVTSADTQGQEVGVIQKANTDPADERFFTLLLKADLSADHGTAAPVSFSETEIQALASEETRLEKVLEKHPKIFGSAIESFFVGIAHAHSSKIDGARLALDLKEDGTKPTIFSFTKEGESLI
ncbi:MAG TPA: hypothetical protein VD883_01325, partial [Candidatus Omnitrophota bacterium]|nr:hypothetical protein [Candidatus Omnitrophota bacterium]